MWRVFGVCLFWLALVLPGEAAERPEGLMWNRSGLPAKLPLQIKTVAGADYLLHLRDMGTGQDVLAAYIRGGEFFRVLVPPGLFELHFASGTDWRGEAALFGPATRRFVLDPPLAFGATATKRVGHLVDLRNLGDVTTRDFAICQRFALDPDSVNLPWSPVWQPDTALPTDGPREYPVPRYDLVSRICE
ncbi:hypothetical protein [Defluviimonas sp. SAOS-178_SWC]|uniref:hypothetical protein n=1 Tax=Defluviimonas sp. SAOS-178_SWC TaxID=3121287 RepID=UPI003221CA67